jgi:exodeoxyribonuclease V alpha subunit
MADAQDVPPSSGFAEFVSDHIVTLQKNRRLTDKALPIGELAKAVNEGNFKEALEVLNKSGASGPVVFLDEPNPTDFKRIVDEMAQYYDELLAWPRSFEEIFGKRLLNKKKLLCALRRGPVGSERLNLQIQRRLAASRGFNREGSAVPVLITENDYRTKLFNGDTGVISQKGERKKAHFLIDGKLEEFFADSLPAHELAYAMTVHKSQGSEFDEVILLLPKPESPILTRELLYTAITRAKERVRILGPQDSVIKAIETRTTRHSGLEERLRAGLPEQHGEGL